MKQQNTQNLQWNAETLRLQANKLLPPE